jgi:hypothetical protein
MQHCAALPMCACAFAGFGKRCQYYFIWGLSEAGINASGFGFSGYKGDKPKFDRYTNTEVFKVRCAQVNENHFPCCCVFVLR